MTTHLHKEMAITAGNLPAGYIDLDVFTPLVIGRLIGTVEMLKGKDIPVGNFQLGTRLRDIKDKELLEAHFVTRPNLELGRDDIYIEVSPAFTVTMEIFPIATPAMVISLVTLEITKAATKLSAANNTLILEGVDVEGRRSVDRQPGADTIIRDANIDPLEAARVEGHLSYGVVSQALSLALSEQVNINLVSLFPSVNFGTAIDLGVLQRGKSLGVFSTTATIRKETGTCDCKMGDGHQIGRSTVDSADPDAGPLKSGSVKIGGPIPKKIDPLRDLGRRRANSDGLVGLYIPQPLAEQMLTKTNAMPSVLIERQSSSTIGYKATGAVGFKNAKVSFDQAGGGLLVDFDMEINISAMANFEIFKGKRVPIGAAIVMLDSEGPVPHVQIGFYPVVTSTGAVYLKGISKTIETGRYWVVVTPIGSVIGWLSASTLFGIFVDIIISGMIANSLPWELARAIEKAIGNNEWKLIDGLPLPTGPVPKVPYAAYDLEPTSILASLRLQLD